MRPGRLAGAVAAAAGLISVAASAQETLPTIEVVGVSPVAGSEIDINKVPSNVQTAGPEDFDHAKAPDLTEAINRAIPGVSLSNQSGNPFQVNLDYRGFTASPVPGTPQGIAVYQNGVRINEAYGDVVNWDFIPEAAVSRMTMMPNNPLFGLNAIGGAMSIEMKNGFTYQGTEVELRGGSYGRIGTQAQTGIQNGIYSIYAYADAVNDSGWREFSSSSQLRRAYVDVGARPDASTEFHVSLTAADDFLGAVVATPVQLLNQSWSSVYTWPQTSHLQLAFLQGSMSWKPTSTFSFQSNAYYRGFWQAHVDGNGTDAQPCADASLLCIGDPFTSLNINASGGVPNNLPPGAFLGEIDRNWVTTNSFGGSVQATSTSQVADRDNHLVMGVSLDHGRTQFTGSSELGTVDQNLFITGTGVFIDQPGADLSPVSLLATNTYVGVYATDTIDVTSQLSITAGGRYNLALIDLTDETGMSPLLNSENKFSRFNPVIGMTYKFTPGLTAYAGYSEANRAPTPLELGCSDPAHPCQIDNFLIADPPLKQVVAHTYEAGLRGEIPLGGGNPPLVTKEGGATTPRPGRLTWALGVFRTSTDDDIINVASAEVQNFGYFANAGQTLRQGVEAKINYGWDRWSAYANYTYINATYQSTLTLQSPDNPAADANGNILVTPGDHIPGIPAHRFKAGADYQITDAWKLGADLSVVGSQYLIHDDSNQNPKVPAYWVVNMHASYQVTKNVEVFGLVQNLFNQHYYYAGTFFQTGGFTNVGGGNNLYANLTDPLTYLPGMPLSIYAGLRVKFDPADPAALVSAAAPGPAAAPPYNWTGFYIGANVGGAFATGSYTDTLTGESLGSGKSESFIGGGQVGYNYQTGIVVLGVEAMFDGFALTSGAWPGSIGGDTLQNSARVNWMTTVAGRIGVASSSADHWLFYAKGGAGWADASSGLNDLTAGTTATTTATRDGWLAGVGVELAFAPNWTMKLEYDYLGLGNYSVASPIAPGDTFNVTSNNIQTITLGFNYLLNSGPAVVARF